MKLQPISKAAGFNHKAAEDARQWVLEDPDRAMAVLPFLLYESVQNDIFDHREVIQKALDIALEPQLSAISKALGSDPYNRNQQGEFARAESRRKKPIRYTPAKPVRGHVKRAPAANSLSSVQEQRYMQAYDQVADEIDAALQSGHDVMDTFWTAIWADKDGRYHADRGVGLDPSKIVPPSKFKEDGRLVELGLTSKPNLSAAGAGYDLMTGMSNATTANAMGRAFDKLGNELSNANLDQKLTQGVYPGSGQTGDSTTTSRLFSRLRAGGELATSVMGDNAPGKAKLAAQVATWVGTHGPEAEKVIGPPTQRAAYRYRGVEKKPDPKLQGAIDGAIKASKKQAGDGLGQAEVNSRARKAVIYGWDRVIPGKRPGSARTEHVESPLIAYFQSRLPNPDLYRLQRSSGVLPPSQGVIIDRHGRVAHEAVGYGEDWYLPFNLKNLKALKGGEYVRTRAYGGLTTEDVYTGLVAGARSVTVVSNSGIFTLEFDDNFRGGRRLNDKAARMVSRYGHLLDAVRNGKVELAGLDPSLRAEIKTQAARRYDPITRPNEYKLLVETEEKRARLTPRLSERQRAQIAQDVVDDAARDWGKHNDYPAQDVNDVIEHEAAKIHDRYRAYAAANPGREDEITAAAQAEVTQKWGSPEAAARTMGVEPRVVRAEEAALEQVRRNTSMLKLDGEGFDFAGQALQEQFPYYIASFHARDLKGRTDAGYVPRGKNRPTSTGYRPDAPESPKGGGGAVPERMEAPAATPAKAEPTANAMLKEREAAAKAAAAARANMYFGPEATGRLDPGDGKGAIELEADRGKRGPAIEAALKGAFPQLLDPDFDVKWRVEPGFAAKAKAQMRIAQDQKVFPVDFSEALGAGEKKRLPWDYLDSMAGATDFDFGPDFDADAGGSDPEKAVKHWSGLLDSDSDIQQVIKRAGWDPNHLSAMQAGLVGKRAATLAALRKNIQAEEDYAKDREGKYDPHDAGERADLIEDLRGLDKLAVVLKHWRVAEEGARSPIEGQVVAPDSTHVLLANSPEDAAKAIAGVQKAGREPIVGGPIDTDWKEQLKAAGFNVSPS